jgi:hypothetical protein
MDETTPPDESPPGPGTDAITTPPERRRIMATGMDYVPAAFLLWSVIGIFRPVFEPTASFEPIFWYVAGASFLTFYGRFVTHDVDGEEDEGEAFNEKYHFSLPKLFSKDAR